MSQLTPYVLQSIAAGLAIFASPTASAQVFADLGRPAPISNEPISDRVTVSFIESEVGDALRLVGRQCGVNMVISNQVTGEITLDLDGTTLDETLQAISKVSGLLYERDGDIVTVYIPEYVVGHWWEQILHNQSALRLKTRLLFTPGVMVTSVPFLLQSSDVAKRRLHRETQAEQSRRSYLQ